MRTAIAKGVPLRSVLFTHTLPNALLPLTTVAGVHFGILLGGAVVTETVFAWPGLGTLAMQAVASRDYGLLLGIFLLSSVSVIIFNIATDLQMWLDPRMRVPREYPARRTKAPVRSSRFALLAVRSP